ncbi:LADA_0A00782g1_1 [Lachancea dasiensis]|uniref:LADA_0A00782g1_1 n=1 Tax=Lachancea dasiensis TaxID=1072105 RepID=A0A1G4ILP0_9SACH|nr:LADA_0A00782g1_1 [Lachancea dasiensis]
MAFLGARWLFRAPFARYASSQARIDYCELPNKGYLHIKGPDAVKFINGLVTSKMLPTYVKKNLTTISVEDEESAEYQSVADFDMANGNWGVFKEFGAHGPYISRFGTYTTLLNSKGKLMTDAVIYPTPIWMEDTASRKYPEYLVEMDRSLIPQVGQIFQSHTLVSKVKSKAEPFESLKTWYLSIAFPSGISEENPWLSNLINPMETLKAPEAALNFAKHVLTTFFEGNQARVLACFIDPRSTEVLHESPTNPQVFRLVTKADVTDLHDIINAAQLPFEFQVQKIGAEQVRYERLAHGYVDGVGDFKPETSLPLELNFDFIPNAVSFDKGCYVGQELTARTYATGILRKRAVPVVLQAWPTLKKLSGSEKYIQIWCDSDESSMTSPQSLNGSSPFATPSSKFKRQRPAGVLLCFEKDRGVAVLRNEHFKKAFESHTSELYIKVGEEKVTVLPQQPWWYEEWAEDTDDSP